MKTKEKWIKRYRESAELVDNSVEVLAAFNANIDVSHCVSELDLDLDEEPDLEQELDSMKDLISSIAYCVENSENSEVDLGDLRIDLEGDEALGGQAGIWSNYLAGTGNSVIFYTPMLSQELADLIDDRVLYPVIDGGFTLKNVRDASNTDRTKRNHIFEFDGDKTGRLIVSDSLKGFGPYFRKGIEENLETIEENIDCAVFSGFHDAEGNVDAKMEKSRVQLEKMECPIHLEYVHKPRYAEKIVGKIFNCFDSLGLDEAELRKLHSLEFNEQLAENPSLGEAFESCRKIMEKHGLDRIHIHTYRYHLTVASVDYSVEKEEIRKAMLFGELSAIQECAVGKIPDMEDIKSFDMEEKEVQDLEELEHFGDFFELENFAETGIAEVEDCKVVAIPPLIHKNPKRTVGMGDIISAGAFTAEHSN